MRQENSEEKFYCLS